MDNDGDDGPWIGEQMRSPLRNPLQYARYRVFLNASCVRRQSEDASAAFLDRLLSCHRATAPGFRLMLLAFDQVHDAGGRARPEASAFHVPNAYARTVAARYPNEIEWAASVHPYRADAVEALDAAVAGGARAVKWLPNAMGIDPASPRCDPFYRSLARHRIPLLTHGGRERAVRGTGDDTLGNPLRVRRALDHGVRVIVAHCASFGAGVDLDAGPRRSGRAQRRSLREADGRSPLRASPHGRRLRPDPGEPFPRRARQGPGTHRLARSAAQRLRLSSARRSGPVRPRRNGRSRLPGGGGRTGARSDPGPQTPSCSTSCSSVP